MRPRKCLLGSILLTASICISASAQESRAQVMSADSLQVSSIDARILFTGRLLGYFRLPDRQAATGDDACRCPKTLDKAGPDVRDFLSQAAKDQDTILVGTGDNFAPELFSRVFEAPPYPDRRHKDRYTWDWLTKRAWVRNEDVDDELARKIRLGQGRIPMDNVACFLARAGYDAIVPGKHDFHFGPERLRYLARLLASFNEKDDPGYHPVQMLAANVVIQTKYFNGEKAVPDIYRGVQYLTPADKTKLSPNGWGETLFANVSDQSSVLPWLTSITVKSDLSKFEDVRGELVRGNRKDPYNLENTMVVSLKSEKKKDGEYDFALPDGALTAGENYFFCLKKQTGLPYCTRFAVYSPFFSYRSEDWEKGEEHPKDPEPYFFKKLKNGTQVAVFGVVDQELREHVGQLNFAWNNPEERYQTEILVIDPVIALRQLLVRFNRDNPHFQGVKILLAQTSAPRAKQLAVQLIGEFNVVISQGQLEYATPNQTLQIDLKDMVRDPDSPRDGLRPEVPFFVAVPPPYFNPESKKRALRLRELRVTNNSNQKDVWGFAVKGSSQKPTVHEPAKGCAEFGDKVIDAVDKLLKGDTGSSPKNPDAFQLLTLHSMLKKIDADVALIQKRDFFWPPPTDDCKSQNLQDYIDWVLWKGDFLMRRQISGKTLKTILATSRHYEEDDQSNVSLAIEKNRALITLGVTYDNRLEEYFINGLPLEPGRLYTVATTDYIGLGDTGFAELAQPAVGDPRRPRDFERLNFVSSVVCEELKRLDKSITSVCEAPVKADPYFDKLSQDPTDGSPRLGSVGRLKAWAFPGKDASRIHQARPTKKDLFERTQQDRPILSTSLEKASIGFSGIRHRFSEKERANLFAGIPITQLGVRRSHSWDFDQSLKVTLTGKWIDRFVSEELQYSTEVTRQESGPTIVNQKSNKFAFEAGTYLHRTKELPRFVFLTAARYETQFAPPITTFNLETGDRLIAEDLGRSHAVLFKAGPRWENRKSSIEGGYLAGHQFNAITGFVFDPGNVLCSPSARRSVQSCINENSKPESPVISASSMVRAERESRFRHGFFLNFKLVVPLHPRLSYTVENQGEFFFTRAIDNSTDTRYQDVIKQVLSIPLFANLHLEPKLEVFLYQNKIDRTRFWQRQYGLTINYKFDWFWGNRWRDALWYKKP